MFPSIFETKSKNCFPGGICGQHPGDQKPSEMFNARSGEIPRPRQTSIEETSNCVMKPERGALVKSSDPPQAHRVYKKAGDMWRPPASHSVKTYLAAAV